METFDSHKAEVILLKSGDIDCRCLIFDLFFWYRTPLLGLLVAGEAPTENSSLLGGRGLASVFSFVNLKMGRLHQEAPSSLRSKAPVVISLLQSWERKRHCELWKGALSKKQ